MADIFDIDVKTAPFVRKLRKIAEGVWVELLRCPHCGSHWRATVSDGKVGAYAVRIQDPTTWEEYDDTPLQMRYLVESRGGTTDEECIYAGCHGKRVKGVWLCAHHLYEAGSRK